MLKKFIKWIFKIFGFFLIVSALYGTEIKVLVDDDYPPFVFKNNEGKLQGIIIDEWELFSKKNGIKVLFDGSDWEKTLGKMRDGQGEVLDTLFYKNDREKYLDYGKPYYEVNVNVYYGNSGKKIDSIKKIKGEKIGVKRGDAAVELLLKYGADEIIEYMSYSEIIEAFNKKEINVFLMDEPCGKYYIIKYGLENKVVIGAQISKGKLYRAVIKNNSQMLKTINYGLLNISKKERIAIYNKWMINYEENNEYKKLKISEIILLLLLLILSLIIIIMIIKFVKMRKEEKINYNKLLSERKKLDTIFNAVPDVFTVVNKDMVIEDISLGKDKERVKLILNQQIDNIDVVQIEKNIIDISIEYIKKALNDKKIYTHIYDINIANNLRSFESRIIPFEEEKVIVINREITDKIKMQNELKTAKYEVENANLIKNRFLTNISQEIKTPIYDLNSAMEYLKNSNLTDRQKEYFKIMQEAKEKLSIIIEKILDVSQIEKGETILEKKNFRLKDMLNRVEKKFKYISEKIGVKFSFNFENNLPDNIIADEDKMIRVFSAIIENILKITKSGNIEISVTKGRNNGEQNEIIFYITDKDTEIEHEKIKNIFQPLYQADLAAKKSFGIAGLGLGAAKVYAIIMGGNIKVESSYENGVVFTFNTFVEIGRRMSNDLSNRVKKIIIAENNKINMDTINEMVKKIFTGKQIVVDNGIECIKAVKSELPDILILEMYLPIMDGMEVIREIRKNYDKNELPIIGITTYSSSDEVEEMMKIGINELIIRPIKMAELKEKIEKYIIEKQE